MNRADQILKEVVATMKIEGFKINDQEKEMLMKCITGEKSFEQLKEATIKEIKEKMTKAQE